MEAHIKVMILVALEEVMVEVTVVVTLCLIAVLVTVVLAGGGRFANFQCQICLKYGHTTNVCHFRSDMNFQPHESLTFVDPTTL